MSLPAVKPGDSCGEQRREAGGTPPAQIVPLRLRLSCVQRSRSPVEMVVAVCRDRRRRQTSPLHANDPWSRSVARGLLCTLSLIFAWGYTQILVGQLTRPALATTTPQQSKTSVTCTTLLCEGLQLVMQLQGQCREIVGPRRRRQFLYFP